MSKKKETRRNFNLRLSDSERAIMEEFASEMGITLTKYIRDSALNSRIIIQKSMVKINRDTYRQLCGCANNLNQITYSWNTALKLGYTPDFDKSVLLDLQPILEKIMFELTEEK